MTDPSRTEAGLSILGAGPAGLAAGYYARRRGLDVQLYEAGSEVGGNARTLQMGPFRYDTGAHRFHDKNPEITADVKRLVGDSLQRIDVPSQIVWRGRRIDFPLAPFDLLCKLPLRLLAKMAWEQLSIPGASGPEAPHFEEMARRTYGPTLAREFLLNYTQKLWGRSPDRLSPRVAGDRLEGLDLETFVREALRTDREATRHLDGSFLYPEGGYGMIAEATADAVGRERIRTEARITALKHDGTQVTHVVVNDERVVRVQTVVSTLPLTLLVKLLDPTPPSEMVKTAESIAFRNVRLAVLGINRPRLTPNASLYFPQPTTPFTRLYEPKNRSPAMAPADQTVAVLEWPFDSGSRGTDRSPSELRRRAWDLLVSEELVDPQRDDIEAFNSHTIPYAYPILEVGTEAKAAQLTEYLHDFDNLSLLGRSAQFEYTHVHVLFEQARSLTKRISERPPVQV